MLQHMYLILTLKHPGTGLELREKSALFFMMSCYLLVRIMYGVIGGQTPTEIGFNVLLVGLICWFLMNMEYKSIFVAYCLCMMMVLSLMSATTLIFGKGLDFLWFIWSLVMIVKVATTIRQNPPPPPSEDKEQK